MNLKSLLKTNALIIITLLAMSFSGFAQAPNLLNYQGVARNAVGNPLPNQTIKLRLSIHDLLPSGTVVYSEIRQITTSMGGLFSVQVGSTGVSSSTGTIAGINWLVGNKYLQVELDPTSNSNYLDIGTAQLVSVPYSFMAGSAATAASVKTNANLTGVVTSVGNATSIANGAITNDMIGTLNKSKVGLDLVNNTSDASKPISDLTKAALDLKLNASDLTSSLNAKANASDVTSALNTKVDKVVGKDLSTNDYTTDEKTKLAAITGTNTGDQDLSTYATNKKVDSIASGISGVSVTDSATSSLTDPFGFDGTNFYNSPLDVKTAKNLANGLNVLKSNITGIANIGFGISNLYSNTTGVANTSVGFKGLFLNTTGNNNSSFGNYSLYHNTTGNYNSAFGDLSLFLNSTGLANSAFGQKSMFNNTTGSYNTGTGKNTLFNNYSGSYNTAIGADALYANNGSFNTGIGAFALKVNQANNNTGIGYSALRSNTTGSSITAVGSNALYSNSTGTLNTAIGFEALYANTTGSSNVGIGEGTLKSNTTGQFNTAVGARTLYTNTTGYQNTAIGREALYSNTTGYYNTSIGLRALYRNTSGIQNIAIGLNSLYSNTTGELNVAIGVSSLFLNTLGKQNTAIGNSSLTQNSTGDENTASGSGSLSFNSTGSRNTSIGVNSLGLNTTGANNTSLGNRALYTNITGSNNTAIGDSADVASANLTNATAIGKGAIVASSNTIQLGNTRVTNVKTSGTLTAGDVTYPSAHGTSGQVLSTTGSGTLTWTTVSSGASDLHTVGESYGGGIVFYVTSDGKHGLISETQLISPDANSNNNQYIYAYSQAQDMISDSINHSTGGKLYTDWRLPTKSEFAKLYAKKSYFNSSYQDRLNFYVWTSTPAAPPNETAKMVGYYQGVASDFGFNGGPAGVIAIRSF